MALPAVVIGEFPEELVQAFKRVVKNYRVAIQLDFLECVKEFDEKGHSEPYIWPAFFLGDATTLPGLEIEITVPFADGAARELLGEAGKDVKPGDIIRIPERLGRFETTAESFYNPLEDRPVPLLFVGFVAQLLEKDSTPVAAMAAGHEAFAQALRKEINGFIKDRLDAPGSEDIEEIKKAVSKRVRKAIENKVGCWNGFWSRAHQDDELGTLGELDTTLFGHDRIHSFAFQQQQQVFRTPIRSTQKHFTGYVIEERQQQYDLHWHIDVQAVVDVVQLNLPSVAVVARAVDAVNKLQQLDNTIEELVCKLRAERGPGRKSLLLSLEEYAERVRPELLSEFESAWQDFIREQRVVRDRKQSDPYSGGRPKSTQKDL